MTDSVIIELNNKVREAFMRLGDNPRQPDEGQNIFLTPEEMAFLAGVLEGTVIRGRR